MTVDAEPRALTAPSWTRRPFVIAIGRFLRRIGLSSFTSLTRRIVVLNLFGLFALAVSILYLNQFREGLVEARTQALVTQGEIIAAGIAATTSVDAGVIRIDPDVLLEMQAAGDTPAPDESFSTLDFPINPEKVTPLLRRLVSPTQLRARIYDPDGTLIIDSRALFSPGGVVRTEPQKEPAISTAEGFRAFLARIFARRDLPVYQELGSRNGRGYEEVQQALDGQGKTLERVTDKGETIISAAVPVVRSQSVLGVLLLNTPPGEIDEIVGKERQAILRVFLVAATVTLVLSLLLAGTIAGPVKRLAEAAERVRRGVKTRHEIPDFTNRADEIGHLSGALRDMTSALYRRIEAIESFAADVAHELKNPLTSLRSAVETLPLAKSDASRERLLKVIQHDVKRLDRLISDISDASRLDAELQRGQAAPVDLVKLLEAVAAIANGVERGDGVRVTIDKPKGLAANALFVSGHDSRLAQVIDNLVSNARSFSPRGGVVRLSLRRHGADIDVVCDDDGPGVPDHARERIFERFYTDRPEDQGFGQNSGLGLSISRQIVEAHGGRIWVENRLSSDMVLGARFIVRLPALA